MRQVAGMRAIFLGLLLVAVVFAQRDLGTITGIVSDPSGAAIPNAKVTITEVATNLSYAVTTNSTGEYIRPALKAGHLHGGRPKRKASGVWRRKMWWSRPATASA